MFARDGDLAAFICDNAKKIVQGKFHQKLKDAACQLKQLESYTSCWNATKRGMKEVQKEANCKLLTSRAPKHLWDDCFEFYAYIRSNAAHDIYKLDREVPETVMSGETSDISQFCELEWFKWVMFWDETAPFSDDMLKLGHNLGPIIDVGQAMTTKIITKNWQVLHRSMYWLLMKYELLKERLARCQKTFYDQSLWKIGVPSPTRELENIGPENTHIMIHMRMRPRNSIHFHS